MPTFVCFLDAIQGEFEALKEEIFISNITYPPSSSSLNEMISYANKKALVLNEIGNEGIFNEEGQSFLISETMINTSEVGQVENEIGKLSLHYHANDVQDDPINILLETRYYCCHIILFHFVFHVYHL